MNDFDSFGRVNKIKHVRYVLNVSHSQQEKKHFRICDAYVHVVSHKQSCERGRESEMIDRMEKNFEQF